MADKKQAEEPKKKKMPFSLRVLIFFLMVTAVVFIPSTIVIAVCMIPSFVAAIIDRQVPKTAWITVGALNLAGTLPAWFMLWEQGHRLDVAFQIITRPEVLVIAYGGAAFGWLIYNNVTPMVAGIVVSRNEKRLKDIEKRQKELARKWGEEVASR
jgi:hypothetical protein